MLLNSFIIPSCFVFTSFEPSSGIRGPVFPLLGELGTFPGIIFPSCNTGTSGLFGGVTGSRGASACAGTIFAIGPDASPFVGRTSDTLVAGTAIGVDTATGGTAIIRVTTRGEAGIAD